jgi:hypothetical protein
MKKIILIALLTLPGLVQADLFDMITKGTSSEYQHDADIVRLNDLEVMWNFVNEYKKKTGKYPLEGESSEPHYVEIATKQQAEGLNNQPPFPIAKTSPKEFQAILREELGSDIDLPFDPQRVGDSKPALYLYMIQGGRFVLAIHVHEKYPFSKQIGRYYNKIEVSNQAYLPQKIYDGSKLFPTENYQTSKNRKMHKPDYFKDLSRSIREEGAF